MIVYAGLAEPKQEVCKKDTGHSQEFALTGRTPVDVSILLCVNRQNWMNLVAMQTPDRPDHL